ncbi:Asp-tRNA(Asn)/Glu-tRNA(Gln) amidotransferase subunit GatA [candidate division KSB1 bacterium]|nr:Asp-tRNA(Asn)/Glu-tRNA(Gln) amidotransferase subunit GatA [candidate division KSB1 bacterium]
MAESRQTYQQIQSRLNNGETTSEKLALQYIEKINKSDLNAFITVLDERALDKAREVDRKIQSGSAGPLAGMVVAVKDIFSMNKVRTTCGSKILSSYIAPYDAHVVSLLEKADAVIVGKTNMDEFGMGSSTENSAYGSVKNPHDPDRIPGGSSGGSAAAVAADLAMTALGSDTGGSVRQPAALCGIAGLRPTYGRISRYGLIAFASSLDTVGLFSQFVSDCADLLQVLAGEDGNDSTSSPVAVPDYHENIEQGIKGLRVGVPEEYFRGGLDSSIRESVQNVLQAMEKEGAVLQPIKLPMTDYGIATYYLICTAEASSNLARYDAVKYGFRASDIQDLDQMYLDSRHDGFGDEVKRRIMLGTYVLSAGYYDAYYIKAQKCRTLIQQDFKKAFEDCDVIIGPTTPTTAFKLGEKVDDPMSMYLSDIYTVTAPLAGLPAISIPIGKDDSNLPIGIQITSDAFQEDLLFRVANWIETSNP